MAIRVDVQMEEHRTFRRGFDRSPEIMSEVVRRGVLLSIFLLSAYEYYNYCPTNRTLQGNVIHFVFAVSGICAIPPLLEKEPFIDDLTKVLGIFAGAWVALHNFPEENVAFRLGAGGQAGIGIASFINFISESTRELGSFIGSLHCMRSLMGRVSYALRTP